MKQNRFPFKWRHFKLTIEVEGGARIPLVLHRRAEARRYRSTQHDEEGTDQEIRWERQSKAGEICREPIRDRCLVRAIIEILLISVKICNTVLLQ